jgi:hypothetical protein
MKTRRLALGFASLTFAATAAMAAQDAASCPMHAAHTSSDSAGKDAHHAGVDRRGDREMGFDHTKTAHHFILARTGGSIEVTANSADDVASRDAIRGHLQHIAKMFSEGNFKTPMLIHDRVPPGVPTMEKRKSEIRWTYEDLPAGGRVIASTKDAESLNALHEFLRFQIEDHRTGDPGTVEPAIAPAPPQKAN